jgi:putative ABC transport system substrate-binding protein
LCFALWTACFLRFAHPLRLSSRPKKIPRIGFLIASSAYSQAPRLEAFKQGKRALGYVEGRNVLIEIRSGEGDT